MGAVSKSCVISSIESQSVSCVGDQTALPQLIWGIPVQWSHQSLQERQHSILRPFTTNPISHIHREKRSISDGMPQELRETKE